MGLKERKYICNTGKLPGFEDGIPGSTVNLTGGSVGVIQGLGGVKTGSSFGTPTRTTSAGNNIYSNNINSNYRTPVNQSVNPNPVKGLPTNTINGITTNAGTGGNHGVSSNQGTTGAASGAHPGFAIGAWLGEGVLSGLAAARKSSDQYLMDAGTLSANVNGIGYTKQNNVDVSGIMTDYDNEAGSAWLANPGKALTMMFGRSYAKRQAENAAIHADIMQGAARDNAYTLYLRLDNAKRYGNQDAQLLYAAANGKLPKFAKGKPTYSVFGETNAKPNAKLSGEEIIYNKQLGIASEVGGPANNKDQEDGFLYASDGVLSKKRGIYGYSPADLFKATGNILEAEDYMVASNMVKDRKMYKCGKLPKFAAGWVGNFATSGIGALMGLELMYHAYKNKPYKPNTYVANPYETEALSTLAGLRVNPYPIMNQLRSAEARTNRAVDIAGGLGGNQRALSRLGALNTTLNNIANLLMNAQLQNNLYKTQYAQSALNAGNATRLARMSANQYDLDYFSKAHAARLGGIQMGARNILEQAQQYYANEFKRNQFNDTMALYQADLKQRREADAWLRKWLASQASINNNETLTDSQILDMYKRGKLRRVVI